MKRIIIWLFNRFCFDYWVEQQIEESKRETMARNNLQTDEELEEYYSDVYNAPLREAYYAGKEDGYNKAMEAK